MVFGIVARRKLYPRSVNLVNSFDRNAMVGRAVAETAQAMVEAGRRMLDVQGVRDADTARIAGSKDRRPTPCPALILGGFTSWVLRGLTSGILRWDRQDSAPNWKRTSDNGVQVQKIRLLMCTAASLHAADSFTVGASGSEATVP